MEPEDPAECCEGIPLGRRRGNRWIANSCDQHWTYMQNSADGHVRDQPLPGAGLPCQPNPIHQTGDGVDLHSEAPDDSQFARSAGAP